MTFRWTSALAAAAIAALPAAGYGQTTGQTTTGTAASTQATPTRSAPTDETATSAAEHVRDAKEALAEITPASVPAADRTTLAELRTHLNSLERLVATSSSEAATSTASAKRATPARTWVTEATASDKLLTRLIGTETPASTPDSSAAPATPVGTSGRTADSALSAQARTQLLEVRRHLNAAAAAMSGTSPAAGTADAATTTPPASAAVSTNASVNPTLATSATVTAADPQTTQAAPPASSSSTTPPASGATPPASSAAQTQGAGSTPPPTASPAQPPAPGTASQPDAAAAKQHLSEARETLSQLTSMPEAAKLQGDARNQVSQLIANFNTLITTQNNWRAADTTVQANLTALIGPDTTDEQAIAAANPTTGAAATTATTAGAATAGTAGTVGTTGTVAPTPAPNEGGGMQLDPAVHAKLVEFRTHLKEFEQAAGGK